MGQSVASLIVAAVMMVAASGAEAQTDVAARCAALAKLDLADLTDAPTAITSATLIAQTETDPAYCKVEGYIAPQIGIEMRLPATNWNGKFVKSGCGGPCGVVQGERCEAHVARGYACIVSDMGHKGFFYDALWAYNNWPAKIDYAFRATHASAVLGKALADRYYGVAPAKSYYEGCSTGGRQGLVAAQRYPADFDGIIAGAPIINYTGNVLQVLWGLQALRGADGRPMLSKDDIGRLHTAVLETCDAEDGLADGILQDPRQCRFDPRRLVCGEDKQTGCFSPAQIDAIAKVYTPVRDPQGLALYTGGPVPGAEPSWLGNIAAPEGPAAIFNRLIQDVFRYHVFIDSPGPSWTFDDFDWSRDPQRMGGWESILGGSNPDLRKFKDRGGKLIVYQGWDDSTVFPRNIIDYRDTVARVMGGEEPTQAFLRLFMVPGLGHCLMGPGTDTFDWMTLLEDWVEKGRAPDMAPGAKMKTPRSFTTPIRFPLNEADVAFRRPVYAYPRVARFNGRGDPADPARWTPVTAPWAPDGR